MPDLPFELPNLARIKIITEYDDMVAALDRKKAEVSKDVFDKPMDERMKIADQLAAICEDQAPLLRKAQDLRSMVVVLAERGEWWMAFETLFPSEAKRFKKALEPTVQNIRDARDKQETVQ